MNRAKLLLLLILPLILISCTKSSFAVNEVLAFPFERSNGQQSLALYVNATLDNDANLQMKVTDPSGALVWDVKAPLTDYDGGKYYGNSDICMPLGLNLPSGTWHLSLICSNGQTEEREFKIP